jgi:hypothetical protein
MPTIHLEKDKATPWWKPWKVWDDLCKALWLQNTRLHRLSGQQAQDFKRLMELDERVRKLEGR